MTNKRPRLKLDPEAYRELCYEVLKRDGWRCQSCGRTKCLQVHHIQPRGRLGDDAEDNLITLCVDCHQACHGAKINCDGSGQYPGPATRSGKILMFHRLGKGRSLRISQFEVLRDGCGCWLGDNMD
jgi:hypothetical protein